jgi:hypothetical protein
VQAVDAAGTLTSGTGADAAVLVGGGLAWGLVDELELNASKVTENISPVTETKAHHVSLGRRDSLTITEILRTGKITTISNCFLSNLWSSPTSRYVQLVFTRGGNTWSGYFLMQGYEETLRRGKNVGRMTLSMIDPGQTNAAYS